MAIAIEQSSLSNLGPGDGSATITFGSAATAGNSLLFLVQWRTDAEATAVTSLTIDGDTPSSESNATIGLTQAPLRTSLNDPCHAWGYLSNITTADIKTCVVQLNNGGGVTSVRFSAWELSGCDTTGMYGASVFTAGGSSQISSSLTTTAANSAIFAAYENDNSAQTVQTGWEDIAFTNLSWYSDGAYKLDNGAIGSKTIDPASTSTPSDWGLTAVEIKAAAAASSIIPMAYHHYTKNIG